MSGAADRDELGDALASLLGAALGRRIVALKRLPSQYRSSFSIEDLQVRFADGGMLDVVFKDLSPAARSPEVVRCRPAWLYDPAREIYTYRELLAPQNISAPTCYAAVEDSQNQRYWLLLERVRGVELYQVGEIELWEHAARWLARLHGQFESAAGDLAARGRLLVHDASALREWAARAARFVGLRPDVSPGSKDQLARVADRYDVVVERLAHQRPSVLHGDFYASNVMVEVPESDGRACVRPVDWEMAAIGPPALDLAALTAGKWSAAERARLVDSYCDERASTDPEQARESFEYARLHLAVQWLGWSEHWSPPPQHAHDWLGEALQLSSALRLA